MNAANKTYFTNLDVLRFFAFFGVFMSHAWRFWLPEMHTNHLVLALKNASQVGVLGVNFFFVLSGFLITYLLFTEREETGTNNLLKFYARRTLRIWPLYFGIVLVSFYVVPLIMPLLGKTFYEPSSVLYFLTFTVNFEILQGVDPYSPLLAMLWSIAIEEQFYIAWPLLFKLFYKRVLWLFALVILGCLVFRFAHMHQHKVIYFHTLSIISDFGIGGLAAWVAISRNRFYHWLVALPKVAIVLAYVAIIAMLCRYDVIFATPISTAMERVILGAAFAFIIFEQCFCTHSIFKLGNIPVLGWLGKISYGLYCFHALGIIAAKDILLWAGRLYQPLEYMVLFPLLALLITIAIAGISYYFYEKPFLRLKERFSFHHS